MNDLFDLLLVSSPNGGGLFFLYEGIPYLLDNFNTTGLSLGKDIALRGIQSSLIRVYDRGSVDLDGKALSFSDIHDICLYGDTFCFVGTGGNEIVRMTLEGRETDRWTYPGEEDSMHINCLAVWNGRLVFSAFGDFREHRGYKGRTQRAGFVQDLLSGERIIKELSQPHSLTPSGSNLLLADSENRSIHEYDASGNLLRTKVLNGYTRGILVSGRTLFVGLSRSRNVEETELGTATLVALERDSWRESGRIELPANEIYSIRQLDVQPESLRYLAAIASSSFASLLGRCRELEHAKGVLHRRCRELEQAKDSLHSRCRELEQTVERISCSNGGNIDRMIRKFSKSCRKRLARLTGKQQQDH